MADQQRLGRVFVELADTLVTDFDVVDFMTVLAHRCVELLGAREAGVALADERGLLRSVASSHESAHLLELFELQNQEGPCLDCYRTGQPILNQSLAPPDNQWPKFAEEATAARLHDGPRPADATPGPGHRGGQHLRLERDRVDPVPDRDRSSARRCRHRRPPPGTQHFAKHVW